MLVGVGGELELGEVDGGVEQPAGALHEGHGGLRGRRRRDVGRHCRPERRRSDAEVVARGVQHAGDAGGALVAGGEEVEHGGVVLVVGRAEHGDGAGVGDLGQQGAEGDDGAGAHGDGHAQDVVAERAPAQLRLDAGQGDDAPAVRRWWRRGTSFDGQSMRRRPSMSMRTSGRVVVKSKKTSGSTSAKGRAPPLLGQVVDGGGGGVAGVVPAPERGEHDRPVRQVGLGRPAQMGEALARGVRHPLQGTGGAGPVRLCRASAARPRWSDGTPDGVPRKVVRVASST